MNVKAGRHAHACGLFSRCRKKVIRALECIIEGADRGLNSCTASAVASAVQLHAKLSREEEDEEAKVKAAQSPNLLELMAQMPQAERDAFARDGSLPEWLLRALGATPTDRVKDKAPSVVEFSFCGMRRDRTDIGDSVEYVSELRRDLRG